MAGTCFSVYIIAPDLGNGQDRFFLQPLAEKSYNRLKKVVNNFKLAKKHT